MGHNSGKLRKRRGKFAPPKVPKSEELKPYQCYGVITKFHGGTHRNMDVTVYDAASNLLHNIKCKLKGSLRHFKCKQRVQPGSYCVTDYDDVIIIFTDNQHASIPSTIFTKLSNVCKSTDHETENVDAEDVDFMPDYGYSDDSNDDISFEEEEKVVKETCGDDIDSI